MRLRLAGEFALADKGASRGRHRAVWRLDPGRRLPDNELRDQRGPRERPIGREIVGREQVGLIHLLCELLRPPVVNDPVGHRVSDRVSTLRIPLGPAQRVIDQIGPQRAEDQPFDELALDVFGDGPALLLEHDLHESVKVHQPLELARVVGEVALKVEERP